MNPLNKILLGVGAAIALIIAVVFLWLSISNAHLKTELAEAQANGTACHLANQSFAENALRQNQAVERLRRASMAREKEARAASFEAQKTVRAYFLAAEKMRAEKPRGDACKAAEALFDVYLKGAP